MTKISEFKAKQRLEIPLLIKEIKNGTTSKGSPYLTIVLQDSSGTIDGKFWDVKPQDEAVIHQGRVEKVALEVIEYNHNLQCRINRITPIDENTIDINDYVIASGFSEQERRDKTEAFVHSIQNKRYQTLVKGMLDYVGDRYYSYPAASRIHHNFLGGLSEHSLSMAEICETVAKHYPQLDRDLLISAALIHDVGKTEEMSGPVSTEYTLQGKLEGHISLANGWLTEVAEKYDLEDTEEAILLHHMILSHHGHYEYGSPVLPMLQEAEVLSLIDNLDARMNTLEQALSSTKPGAWTQKLFALDGRQFYKPKNSKE